MTRQGRSSPALRLMEPASVPTAAVRRKASEIARGFEAARAARDARAARRVKITDALLREVATVYRANVNDKPTEAVAEHFGRQHRTATHYIKRARERGFLGSAIKGKAGEQ
jgi:hypothetical protein